jgi:hypothetical protein
LNFRKHFGADVRAGSVGTEVAKVVTGKKSFLGTFTSVWVPVASRPPIRETPIVSIDISEARFA